MLSFIIYKIDYFDFWKKKSSVDINRIANIIANSIQNVAKNVLIKIGNQLIIIKFFFLKICLPTFQVLNSK